MSPAPAFGRLRHPAVLRLAQLAVGVLFLASALAKIGDLPGFALQVHNYRLAPVWSENLLAIVLPWIELVAGLALVVGVRARAAGALALALLAVFTVAVGAAWARGLDFECGCFGRAVASRIGAEKFGENVVFCAVALVAALPRRDEADARPADERLAEPAPRGNPLP